MDDVIDFLRRHDDDHPARRTPCLGCGEADCCCDDDPADGVRRAGAGVWCECGAPRDGVRGCVAGCRDVGGEG